MPHASAPHPFATNRWRIWALFGFVFALTLGRFLYQADLYPIYFDEEGTQQLRFCANTAAAAEHHQSWLKAWSLSHFEYNKGYAPLFLPAYQLFGYDTRILIYGVSLLSALTIAAFVALYAYVQRPAWTVWLYTFPVVSCVLLTLSLRRYKWHPISYLAALSAYLILLPQLCPGLTPRARRSAVIGGILLWLLCTYAYFGNLIYAGPIILAYILASPPQKRRRAFILGFSLLTLSLLVCAAAYWASPLWRYSIDVAGKQIATVITPLELQWRCESVGKFFTTLFSTPGAILVGWGLAVTAWKAYRGNRFALLTCLLLATALGLQLCIIDITNIDWLNWAMLPLLAAMLLGWGQLSRNLLRWPRAGACAVVVLTLGVTASDLISYPARNLQVRHQDFISPKDTRSQLALLLKLRAQLPLAQIDFFLPSPDWPQNLGGFDSSIVLVDVRHRRAYDQCHIFRDEADLRQQLAALPADRTPIAFLSRDATTTLLGQPAETLELAPGRYPVPFFVRAYPLRSPTGQTAAEILARAVAPDVNPP